MSSDASSLIGKFYALHIKSIWRSFTSDHFSFWMICFYLIIEYVRPQAIYPALAVIPWGTIFGIGAAIGCVVDPSVRWTRNPANKWVVLFFLVIIISSFVAEYPEIAFANLDQFYYWLIVYFLIINIVNTKARFLIFLGIILIASFKVSLGLAIRWAAAGFEFDRYGLIGPSGYFSNSGELAIQMVIFCCISFAFVVALRTRLNGTKWMLTLLMPLTALLTILGSSSRGGQLAIAAAFAVYFHKKIFKPKIIIGILLLSGVFINFLPEEQIERFRAIGEDRTSLQRIAYWEKGVQMISDNPFLGVGYFNFAPYFERHYPELMYYGKAQLPHNIFIQVGTDVGFVGLSIYLILIILAFKNVQRVRGGMSFFAAPDPIFDELAKGLNAAFLGFLVAGQFVSVAYYPFMWIHLAITVCFSNVRHLEK